MIREPMKILVPMSGIEVLIKPWLTGKERMEINQVILDSQDLTTDQVMLGKFTIKGKILEKLQRALIEAYVVSVGESKDVKTFYDTIMNFPDKDSMFIINKINDINGEEAELVKK